ncbi:hypothetical protein EYF80_032476 [Liparis tanakae]|uniref:Uncharacterized protein n=1 Tax=Liparis tanakae TaxID=230148 RepID=A0A4Z2GUK8_9TELE|nr:hypothetical protein EYF80_032476 [Liparis tanakae]
MNHILRFGRNIQRSEAHVAVHVSVVIVKNKASGIGAHGVKWDMSVGVFLLQHRLRPHYSNLTVIEAWRVLRHRRCEGTAASSSETPHATAGQPCERRTSLDNNHPRSYITRWRQRHR